MINQSRTTLHFNISWYTFWVKPSMCARGLLQIRLWFFVTLIFFNFRMCFKVILLLYSFTWDEVRLTCLRYNPINDLSKGPRDFSFGGPGWASSIHSEVILMLPESRGQTSPCASRGIDRRLKRNRCRGYYVLSIQLEERGRSQLTVIAARLCNAKQFMQIGHIRL